jgi:hypothetical protein
MTWQALLARKTSRSIIQGVNEEQRDITSTTRSDITSEPCLVTFAPLETEEK